MSERISAAAADLLQAFKAYERQERLRNTKVGCILVVTLMPAGSFLDYFVYPDQLWPFLQLRLGCAAVAALIWGFLHTDLGRKSAQGLGIVVPLLPVVFIAWMIAVTEGFASPYYAGLNLVLLAVGAVLRWTVLESVMAVGLVLLLYMFVGLWHGAVAAPGILFNNLYFIALMDVIVVVGTYFQYRQRFREFVLRYELDQNREKLEETNRKLVELDQVKSRFFANISHELRTPLTLLLAPLETLLQRRMSAFEPEIRDLLVIMQGNGMRLLKLINDLLDLVRLESGRMEAKREPVAIEPFIRGLGNAVRKTAEDRGIRLETGVDATVGTVMVDSDKLEKILLNLLFNALKFTPGGGTVRLRASRQEGEFVLEVSDTGIGISDEQLPFVFDRFWQADTSSQRKYQGVGIGLALVKELVEIQGGRVAVQSGIRKGARFTIRLPYLEADLPAPSAVGSTETPLDAAPPGAESPDVGDDVWLRRLHRDAGRFPSMTSLREAIRPIEIPSNHSQQLRVLIADDEPDMLKYLKSQLARDFQVIEAVDGQQAVDKASQFLPDVIVCDMMMPGKDGLEVCRDLRQRTSTRAIPILLLTARADEETKLTALSAGANDFVTKPFSTIELSVRLKNLVGAHHLQQELVRKNQILETTIEQLKETEAQLIQSEKLASLGRMSAGIIHEINNPLNFAKTGLYTLRGMAEALDGAEGSEFREILQDAEDGVNRVIHIVSDLRSFTQPNMADVEPVSVIDLVDSALRFVSGEWRDKVKIEKEIPDNHVIWANPNQATQILLNLLQNALDALRGSSSTGEPTIWIHASVANGESLIVIRDNGEGIAEDHIHKIFDPFFTTKEVGQGMGLGLSICYRIMKQHGGRIEVRSEQGRYTEFTLRFPEKSGSRSEITAA
jgi:signal transduction histidine kinase